MTSCHAASTVFRLLKVKLYRLCPGPIITGAYGQFLGPL